MSGQTSGHIIGRGYITIAGLKDGDPAKTYVLLPSVESVTKKLDGTLSASSVSCSVYKVTGSSAYALSGDHVLMYRRMPDGVSGSLAHASGTSSAIAVLATTESIEFELKDGTKVLDRVRIPVLSDATDVNNELDKYKYLRDELKKQGTTIEDGLILSSLIALGYTDGNNVRHTLAGINGLYIPALGGRTIGSWWGGSMVDLFDKNNNPINPTPANAATSLIRMDGSGYFAKGNFRWDTAGKLELGDTKNGLGITIDGSTGRLTMGSGITFDISSVSGLKTTLDSIANWQLGLQSLFVPCGKNGEELPGGWQEASQTDTVNGGIKAKSIKAKIGLWTPEFLSTKGRSSGSGGGSGSQFGLYTNWLSTPQSTDALGAVLGKSLYTQQNRNTSDIASLKSRVTTLEGKNYLSDLTLSPSGSGNAVTAVSLSADKKTLTVTKGSSFALSSHTHSQYLTSATAANTYVTLSTDQEISGAKSFTRSQRFINTAPNTSGWGGNAGNGFYFYRGTASESATNMWMGVYSGSAAQDGVITERYMALGWGQSPYSLGSNFAVCSSFIKYKGNNILHTGNEQTLTIQRNGTTAGTYKPSAAATINISDVASAATLSSHTGNTTVHITSSERTAWNNKVDKVSGKGLSTNDFDNTLLAKLNGIEPGANKYVLPTASSTVLGGVKVGSGLAISSGVLAVSLSASHIPNLSWSKITSGKPTTLAGYGITDAKISGGVITLGSNTITPLVDHQPIYSLTFAAGLFVAKTFNPKSAAATVNIPTHTTHIAEGTNKYFTDARAVAALKATTDALRASINTKLDASTFDKFLAKFDSMFERVNIGTTAAPVYVIKAKYGLYTDQFLTAKGRPTSLPGDSGSGGSQFGLMRSWPSSSPGTDTTDALGANLGYQLYINKADKLTVSGLSVRLTALEQKNYLDNLAIAVSGSGNAVTAVSQSADKKTLTFTKGSTFLTSHQSLANYVTLNTTQTISGAKTFGSNIRTSSPHGSWLIGKTEAAIMFNGLTAIDSTSAWYFYNMKSASGHTIAFGGLGDNIGFYTFLADRTENAADSSFVCNTATGQWTTNKNFTAYGFVRTGSSNSYVLLGGGSHKAVSDFALASSLSSYLKVDGSNGSTAGVSALLNKLGTGTSTPSDADYYICQYAGGGTTTTSYHRRPTSAMWAYIKTKADAVYQPKGSYAASGHTHTFASLTSKPTTLAGFGITDAYTKTEANNRYVTLETEQTITATKKHFTGSINFPRSTVESQGGKAIGIYWNDRNQWATAQTLMVGSMTTEDASGNITSRCLYMGWGATPWSGSNNLSVGKEVFTYKGYNVLHSGNYSSTLSNTYVKKSGDTMTGQLTATKFIKSGSSDSYILLGGGGHKALSDISSAYVTALGTNGNYLTWTKNVTVNNVTVPYATNAGSLGGVAASNYLTKSNYSSTLDNRYYTKTEVNSKNYIKVISCYKTTEWSDVRSTSDPLSLRAYDVYGTEAGGPATYGDVLEIVGISGHWQPQLWFDSGKTGNVRHRNKTYSDSTWGDWYILLDTRNYSTYLDSRYYTESEINAKLTNGSVTKVGTATVGGATKGIYLNAGTPTAMTYALSAALNAGTAGKLAYYSGANAVDDYTATVGSSTKPVYINGGVPTASTSTVGASNKPMYLSGGTLTAFSSTSGASNLPVWVNGGSIVAVSSVGEAYLSWGGKSISGSISPLDCAASAFHSANRIAFANPAGIKVEYSRNGGSSWTDYGASATAKTQLVSGQGTSLNIGGTTTGVTTAYRLRVTLDASTMGVYTRARKLLLNISSNGASGCKVLVETATKGSPSSFTTVNTYDISGWSGWNSIPLAAIYFGGSASQTTNTGFIRLTFFITALSSNTSYNNALSLTDIVMLGDTYWTSPSTLAKTGHMYSYDASKNVTFPAAVTATSFNGTLNGTSTSAQKLSTPRSINGSTFDGTASITTVKWGTARNIGILSNDGTSTPSTVSVDGSGNVNLRLPATIKASLTGNATTATGLQTARTLTVGNTGKKFNGTANVTWSLDEIGVYSKSAADSRYVNVSGDTMTGLLTTTSGNHGGLKIGGSYLTANGNDMVLQVARALRFGADAWDANQWAGLKYTHSTKTIALGIADGTEFIANTAQTGGTLKLVNCDLLLGGGDKITFGSDDNAYLNYNSEGKLVLFGKSGINLNTNGRPISANANIATTGTFSSSSGGRSSLPNLSVSYANNSYTLSTSSFICNSWVRTVGSSGWYSETYGGGWRMTDSTYIRSYGTKRVLVDAGAVFNALQIAGGGVYIDNMSGNNAAHNYGYGALTVGIKNDSSQSPLIVACRQNQSLSGSTRLFAMELHNTGSHLCFGFGGATKFRFQNNGVLYATGGMYTDGFMTAKAAGSSSDARLKTNIRSLCLTLETIVGAPSVAFDWKDGKGRGAGTIAQYWRDKLPEVLLTDPEGFYSVSYGQLAHVEICSLAKHLVPRVEKAEDKIIRLERRVAILEKALAASAKRCSSEE